MTTQTNPKTKTNNDCEIVQFPRIPKPNSLAKKLAKKFLDTFYVNPDGELAAWLDIPHIKSNDVALMMFVQQRLDTGELDEDSTATDIMTYVSHHIPALHLMNYMEQEEYWHEDWRRW